jgi:DNA-binding protein H-NS
MTDMTAITTLSKAEQKQLAELLAKAGKTLAEDPEAKRRKCEAMRADWVKQAEKAGLKPVDVWFNGKNGGTKGRKITPKYHWEENGVTKTWAGIGEPPTGLKLAMRLPAGEAGRRGWFNLNKDEKAQILRKFKIEQPTITD